MRWSLFLIATCASSLAAAEISEKFAKRLESADAAYQSAVAKADNVRFYAVQKANQERLKVLKTALMDATKAGDFDAATEIKARVAAAETAGAVRPKPKNTVKFDGHEYALIQDKATWHVAKKHCEEMGGHLAIFETPQEAQFLVSLCEKVPAWVGASDEESEGKWVWVDGSRCADNLMSAWRLTDETGEQHNLLWFPMDKQWAAGRGVARVAYVCEWD